MSHQEIDIWKFISTFITSLHVQSDLRVAEVTRFIVSTISLIEKISTWSVILVVGNNVFPQIRLIYEFITALVTSVRRSAMRRHYMCP